MCVSACCFRLAATPCAVEAVTVAVASMLLFRFSFINGLLLGLDTNLVVSDYLPEHKILKPLSEVWHTHKPLKLVINKHHICIYNRTL